MHGDGNIGTATSSQSEVRCEDCHGTADRYPWELPLAYADRARHKISAFPPRGVATNNDAFLEQKNPETDGYLLTSRGNPFGNFVKEEKEVVLYSASGGKYKVPLLKRVATSDTLRLKSREVATSVAGSHQNMAYIDCHADWLPPCLGCHADTP
jgi:hypothetical protein